MGAKYTIQMEEIIRDLSGEHDALKGVEKASEKIFDKYPIFSEEYRNVLNKKILMHFFFEEIGMETYYAWRILINRKMNEIMPLYNKMYIATLEEFDWKNDIDFLKEMEEHGIGNSISVRNDSSTMQSNDKSTRTPDLLDKTTYGKNTHSVFESNEDFQKGGNSDKTMQGGHTVNDQYEIGLKESSDSGTDKISKTQGITKTEKFSNTPQGALSDAKSGKYLTTVTITEPSSGSDADITTYGKKNVTKDKPANKMSTTTYNGEKDVSNFDETNVSNKNNEELTTDSGSDYSEKTGTEKTESNNSKSEASQSDEKKGDENYRTHSEKTVGKANSGKSYSEMLKEYLDSLVNVDMMIIDELEECFMLIY